MLNQVNISTSDPGYIGSYNFTNVAFISTSFTYAYTIYTVNILPASTPPIFNDGFPLLNVSVGSTLVYNLPSTTDSLGLPVQIVNIYDPDNIAIPTYITYSSMSFTFAPTSISDGGFHAICFYLTDLIYETFYCFDYRVNLLPVFSSSLADQNVEAGTSITYYLPTYSDPDGDTVILN